MRTHPKEASPPDAACCRVLAPNCEVALRGALLLRWRPEIASHMSDAKRMCLDLGCRVAILSRFDRKGDF